MRAMTGHTFRGAPRSGGGGPPAIEGSDCFVMCSPLRRGWSLQRETQIVLQDVLPAQAGVVPILSRLALSAVSAPPQAGVVPSTYLYRGGLGGAPRSGGGGPSLDSSGLR